MILPGYTADVAGPASIISWIILSLLSIPIAYTFARLALRYENFGGIATIVGHAFGTTWSAIVGWFFFAWVATVEAIVGVTGSAYLVEVLGLPRTFLYVFAVGFLAAPLSVLMSKTIGFSAGAATAVVACIVCLGTLNVYLASSSRLGYALAREGKLPAWFAKMNSSGFPYRTAIFLFITNSVVLVVSYLLHVSVDTLILIPTTLGILVYVVASFACVKLLWNDKIGRISALIAAICCLGIAPFSTGFLIVPIGVAACCLLYLRFSKKSL